MSPVSEKEPDFKAVRLSRWRLIVLNTCLCFGLFLSLLDTSIVATALYSIGTDFGALDLVNWVALAYTLAYVGFAVLFTRIGDIVGRKNAYIAAFVIFFSFSLGCGFSQSLNQLIACRALQGVGGSGLYSLAMVIFTEINPPSMLQWIASMAGIVIAVSGVLGPVLGGILTRYASWRWVFWINGPVGIVPMVLFYATWPTDKQFKHIERRSWRELDILGCFLLAAASVLVVLSFQEAGIRDNAWGKGIFLGPLLAGCCCWVLLIIWEIVVERCFAQSIAPIMPPRLLRHRVYLAAVLFTVTAGFVHFVVVYSLPTHFQVVNSKSALEAGVGLLPMLASAAIGSMLGGIISGKRNNIFPVLIVGGMSIALGAGLLSTTSEQTHVQSKVYGFQVFVGLGIGLTVSSVSMLAALESEPKDRAVAQGMMAQARIFGGSIGVAASTAILGVVERHELSGVVSAAQLASLHSSAKTLSLAQYTAIRKAYTHAFDETLWVTAIVACVGFLVAFGTYQKNPPQLNPTTQDMQKDVVASTPPTQLSMDGSCNKQQAVEDVV